MNPRCYIFGALPVNHLVLTPQAGDYVIAADKGLEQALAQGIHPDLLVGDFDSTGYEPEYEHKIVLQVRKDDTDTAHAMEVAYDKGYREFVIYGALGGKLDHTIASIQQASCYEQKGAAVLLIGDTELAKVLPAGGTFSFPADHKGRISVFSLAEESKGVSIQGLDYALDNGTLKRNYPLGMSNAFVGTPSSIHVEEGELLILWDMQDH